MRPPLTLAASLATALLAQPAVAQLSPRQIYQERAPATVLVVAARQGSSSSSAGTGSVIGRDGLVATNCHVIWDASTKAPLPVLHVFLKPERLTGDLKKDLSRHFAAEALACDPDLDLALLRMKAPPPDLVLMPLGDPEEIGPGDDTAAIGMPEQGGLWTITTGRIGNEFQDFKGVRGKHVFQTETSLNRGNSGGPLLDIWGRLVGVNTSIARQGEGGLAIVGINFALKASVLRDFASRHQVALAYAPAGQVRGPGTAVAMAEPVGQKEGPSGALAEPGTPGPAATAKTAGSPEPAENRSAEPRTRVAPDGTGSLTVEDEPETPETPETVEGELVSRKADARPTEGKAVAEPKRAAPARFTEVFKQKPRPYSFSRLFTTVDAVRARSGEAFLELEEEMRRLGWD
jgi:serine protease Do